MAAAICVGHDAQAASPNLAAMIAALQEKALNGQHLSILFDELKSLSDEDAKQLIN